MKPHPYLRAFMAGIAVPTMLLLVAMSVFIVTRLVYKIPVPIERLLVFPTAVVPNLFGLWNIFYVWLGPRHLRIGFHGALLPFVLGPIAFTVAAWLGFMSVAPAGVVLFQVITIRYGFFATGYLCTLIVYYLVWKHLVVFFNEILGIK
jgi:hypothetical protein